MSSSRWKRFAFFDRYSLTIPNEVLEDIIPAIKSTNNNNNNNSSSSGGNVAGVPGDGQQQVQSDTQQPLTNDNISNTTATTATSVTRSFRALTLAGQEASAENESVSLVLTTAALPLLSKPVVAGNKQQQQQSTTVNDNNNTHHQQQQQQSSALDAMWMSLTACSPLDSSSSNKYLNSIELPNQGQQSFFSSQHTSKSDTGSTTTTTTAAAAAVDGLVLCFVTSYNTQLVHCFDLTVRCNPPRKLQQTTTNVAAVTAAAGVADATTKRSTVTTTPLPSEDMDGWRGYFAPFFPQLLVSQQPQQQQQAISSSATTAAAASIVSIASCRCNDRHRPLHVACITNQHVVVWEDPHLHLLYRRPLSTSPAALTPPSDAIIYTRTTTTTTTSAGSSTFQQQQQHHSTSSQQQSLLWGTESGIYRVVDIIPGIVAIGTSSGAVLVYVYTMTTTTTTTTTTTNYTSRKILRPYLRIPPPPGTKIGTIEVVSIKLTQSNERKANAFVSYNRKSQIDNGTNTMTTTGNTTTGSTTGTANNNNNNSNQSTVGICCYEIPLTTTPYAQATSSTNMLSAPSARHDLDGRYVTSSNLVDTTTIMASSMVMTASNNDTSATTTSDKLRLIVARPDGLYSYSKSERTGVAPIDGTKFAMCIIPPPVSADKRRDVVEVDDDIGIGNGYVLVASTDSKSNRDTVDIYDITNNLVAFHLLLSPGHRAVRAAAVTTLPSSSTGNPHSVNGRSRISGGNVREGQSSAVVLTSGGSLVTCTEKRTEEKIALLIQKNLYSAAIVVAYADPSYEASEITALYQTYAEHLYQKGDFAGAIDQYIQTIGSLESSHIIFRYLDAPKIPLLVKYLEKLRSLSLATPMHNDLLRTCYLKLNDTDAAEAIGITTVSSPSSLASPPLSSTKASNVSIAMASVLSNLTLNPKEALATVCSLEAHQAAEVMMIHGASLARAFPRETAGVILSLCLGTFSPKALSEVSIVNNPTALYKLLQYNTNTTISTTTTNVGDQPMLCDPFPAQIFLPRTFVEHPKMLRLVLAHCNRNKCPLTPELRRTLLELTLSEWNRSKRSGDTESEKLRYKEAIAALTDSHSRDIGDYDAMVIVQLAGFEEGELLLYERLQMTPLVLKRYAADGSEKSRRRMLAMCQTDPEILADVLSHFVAMANAKLSKDNTGSDGDDGFDNDECEEIMEHIQECLVLAKRQGVLPPVRIAGILAGEHAGQFSTDRMQRSHVQSGSNSRNQHGVPLSVALDYVGTILDESRSDIVRLKGEVEEYNNLCNAMENEINMLLRVSGDLPQEMNTVISIDGSVSDAMTNLANRLNIDDLYYQIRASDDVDKFADRVIVSDAREAFWREMNHTEDSFETISRFFAKGIVN